MNSLTFRERKGTFALITVLFLLAFVGFVDAFYLSFTHFQGEVVTCGAGGCADVTTSQYSKIFGIPVAYLGLAHYSLMLLSAFFVFALKKRRLLLFPVLPLSVVGVMASAWFVFAQVVLLKAVCYFCMASAVSSLLLFITAIVLVWGKQAHKPEPEKVSEEAVNADELVEDSA